METKNWSVYPAEEACVFKRNADEFGGFSNMASVFPLCVNGIAIRTSEALYHACKFPYHPEVQQKIIDEKSPMATKMDSRYHTQQVRPDWEAIKVPVMDWCIRVKLAQNFVTFGHLFERSGHRSIVENAANDQFWGATPNADGTLYTGENWLGKLLMELRAQYFTTDKYRLLYVTPPAIQDFLLLGKPITAIDERASFIQYLQQYWGESSSLFS